MRLSKLYMISIIKTMGNDVTFAQRQFWEIGKLITTIWTSPNGGQVYPRSVQWFRINRGSSLFLGSSKRTFFRLKIIFMKWIWILISFVGQTIFWKVLSPSDEMWSFYFENETGDPESKRRSEKHSQIQLGVHFWELIFFDTLQIGFWDVRSRHLWCVSGTECFEIRCASAEYFAAGGKWCYALKATGSWNKLLKCFKMSSGVVRYKLHLCDAEICAFCRYWFHLAPFLRLSVRIMNSERRRALCNARIALDLCSKVKTDPKQKQVVKMCRNSFNSFRVLWFMHLSAFRALWISLIIYLCTESGLRRPSKSNLVDNCLKTAITGFKLACETLTASCV